MLLDLSVPSSHMSILVQEISCKQLSIHVLAAGSQEDETKECTCCQHTKDSYWFTVPLSKQRMAISPSKLSVIFDFDVE